MFIVLTTKEKEAIASGNIVLLKKALTKAVECGRDRTVLEKDDIRFVQGYVSSLQDVLVLL